MHLRHLAAIVCVCMATACVGSTAPGSGSPSAAGARTPAFEQVLDNLVSHGKISNTAALQAFALTFGPVPGVRPPSGASEPILSGTGPLRWALGLYGDLSPAQRQQVDTVDHQHRTTSPTAAQNQSGLALVAAHTGAPPAEQKLYDQIRDAAEAAYSAKLGLTPLPTTINLLDRPDPPTDISYASAEGLDANDEHNGPAASCVISVNPKTRHSTPDVIKQVVYHEVFHCFEASAYPDLLHFDVGAPWLIEGGAEWASAVVAGPDSVVASRWKRYFATPHLSLLDREYDAIGFFSHLENRGESPWAHFTAAFAADASGGGPAALATLINGDPAIYDTWATGLLREPGLGPDYDTTGPAISTGKTPAPLQALGPGGSGQGVASPAANDVATVDIEADVAVIGAGPHSRLHSVSGSTVDVKTPSGTYCAKSGGCSCPDGSPGAGTQFTTLAPGADYITVSGGEHGSSWAIATYTLEDFCRQKAVDSCLLGSWRLPGLVFPPQLYQIAEPQGDGALTVTFNNDGSVVGSLDGLPTFKFKDPEFPASMKVGGKITSTYVAHKGVISTSGGDASGLTATITIAGSTVDFPVADLLNALGQDSVSFVTYRCQGNTLEVDNPYVGTQVFTRE